MKSKYFIFIILSSVWSNAFAQQDTSIFMAPLAMEGNRLTVLSPNNISHNPGYNNQPFFLNDNTLVYAKNQSGQTDIASYSLDGATTKIVNKKTEGSEYSPQPLPGSEDITAVRLDLDGKQLLYQYHKNGGNTPYLAEEKVAYYTFFNQDTLVASILSEGDLDLVVYFPREGKKYKIVENSGRCLQKVPNSQSISYTAVNENGTLDLYQLDMTTLESFFVCELPIGVQDYIWYNDSRILIGSGSQLYSYDLFGDGEWQKITNFSESTLQNITRLAVSPNRKHIAFVAETTKQ